MEVKTNYLTTKAIQDLPEGVWYPIYKAKSLQTKFGRSILVWLHDVNTKQKFKVFLTSAICKQIPDYNHDDDYLDNSDDSCNTMPSSVKKLPHFKLA